MANRVPPTPHNADNSSGLNTAACSVWQRGDADSMSARDIHDPTTDAGYTTAGNTRSALKLDVLSYLREESIYCLLDDNR